MDLPMDSKGPFGVESLSNYMAAKTRFGPLWPLASPSITFGHTLAAKFWSDPQLPWWWPVETNWLQLPMVLHAPMLSQLNAIWCVLAPTCCILQHSFCDPLHGPTFGAHARLKRGSKFQIKMQTKSILSKEKWDPPNKLNSRLGTSRYLALHQTNVEDALVRNAVIDPAGNRT